MKWKAIGIATIVLAVAIIIGIKFVGQTTPLTESPKQLSKLNPQVILFTDPREANEAEGCGEIFRYVRGASEAGVNVEEIAPWSGSSLIKEYRIATEPTVLILNEKGEPVARYEGESRETIAEIGAQMRRLASERP